ncbi:hypothetical protein ACIQ9P_22290 [Kitasatospora sp. NPDC094019]|uniref:hypothetical protein n=1 Tax=Kitasatospora sp. NPDC094019 TaxID=3364091 RepID=UPI0037F210FD
MAGPQPSAPVVEADATPVTLGRALVLVQAGDQQTAPARVVFERPGVLQQPGIEPSPSGTSHTLRPAQARGPVPSAVHPNSSYVA